MLVGGLVNSLLQSRNDRKNTQRTIAGQKELSQYAFSQNQVMAQDAYNRDVSMWERQNAYNDPSQQMSRLKGAGLNPNLIYGAGTSPGNQSGPPPSFSPASYQAPDIQYRFSPIQIPQMLGEYQNFQMRSAQIDNVRAQTQSARMRTLAEGFGLTRGKALFPYQAEIMRQDADAAWFKPAQASMNFSATSKLALLREAELERQPLISGQMSENLLYSRYRNEWMKAGITSSDHPFFRIISRMWNEAGLSVSNVRRKIFGK